MADIIQEYFIRPIETGEGYNIVNTLTYAVILIASLFLIRWLLRKLGVRLDAALWRDLLPFVFLGGIVRALVDSSLLPHSPLFITPGIYLLIFGFALAAIVAQVKLHKPAVRWVGFFLLAAFGIQALLAGKNWEGFLAVLALAAFASYATFFLARLARLPLFKNIQNKLVLGGHALDASASFISIGFLCVSGSRYFEQHVVSGAIFGSLPGWAFIPIKLGVVSLALHAIDKEASGDWNWLLKFTLLVLGLGPGVRDATTALINSGFC